MVNKPERWLDEGVKHIVTAEVGIVEHGKESDFCHFPFPCQVCSQPGANVHSVTVSRSAKYHH